MRSTAGFSEKSLKTQRLALRISSSTNFSSVSRQLTIQTQLSRDKDMRKVSKVLPVFGAEHDFFWPGNHASTNQ